MISISSILVPTILSPGCGWAARYGEQLARRLGSKLVFVHVGAGDRGQIDAFLSAHMESASPEVYIRDGDPAEAIVRLSHDLGIGMILMPTHAHGWFRRFLLGSVTAKVLHDAQCPVLTGVHRKDIPAHISADLRSIVCAVDVDHGFEPVVRFATGLATLVGAALTAVHAVPAVDETSDNRGEVELRQYLFERASKKFEALCLQTNVNLRVCCAGGPVDRVVREAALRQNADLVVVGRGHTQQELGRLRTHTYSIIRNSPCPVLSV